MPNAAAIRQALSAMLDHIGQSGQGGAMQPGPMSGQPQSQMVANQPPSMMGQGGNMRAALQNAIGQQAGPPQATAPAAQLEQLRQVLRVLEQRRMQMPPGPQAQQLDAQIAQLRQVLGEPDPQAGGQPPQPMDNTGAQ